MCSLFFSPLFFSPILKALTISDALLLALTLNPSPFLGEGLQSGSPSPFLGEGVRG